MQIPVAWCLATAACTLDPSTSDTSDPTRTGDSDTDADIDTDTDPTLDDTDTPTLDTDTDTTDTDTGIPLGPGVKGTLVDPDGVPVGLTRVLCCTAATCFTVDTLEDGTFALDLDPGTEVAVKSQEKVSLSWAAALEPVVIGDERIDLEDLYIPELPPAAPLGPEASDPQTVAPGDDLTLTLNVADLTTEIGVALDGIAARKLPEDRIPTYGALGGRTPLAVYALHPFGTTSSSPVGVQVPTTLPAGSEVQFWAINHIDGTFFGPWTGHSDGTFASTDPGQGIDLLTYLVLSEP